MVDIQEMKSSHFKGFARVWLRDLRFHTGRGLDDKNVKRLSRIFRAEGCHKSDRRYVLPVVVEERVLTQALNGKSCVSPCLLSQLPTDLPLLSIPDNKTIICLHGMHRVYAAKKVLPPCEQWWTAEVYDSGK